MMRRLLLSVPAGTGARSGTYSSQVTGRRSISSSLALISSSSLSNGPPSSACSKQHLQHHASTIASCQCLPSPSSLPSLSSRRFFSRRVKGPLNDPAEEFLELQEAEASKKWSGATNLSAVDMEFFGSGADDYNDTDIDGTSYNNEKSSKNFFGLDDGDYVDDDDEEDEEDPLYSAEYRKKQEEIRMELDSRTGRPWTDPWEIKEEQWMSTTSQEDLPDFSPEQVSRISQERIQIYSDGIPTLDTLAGMNLPQPACPHPGLGQAKAYAKYRARKHQEHVSEKVRDIAKSRIEKIMALSDWDDKQDAIDELFEAAHEELKAKEEILGRHPHFGKWVERGLEEYLRSVNANGTTSSDSWDQPLGESSKPWFMDCYDADDGEKSVVPSILAPLQPHPNNGPGRMVEEWELSAHKKTKRILLRDATKSIARILNDNEASRIFVHGRRGTGKSAILASIVACARKSGYVVLYLPDGDRLRKNGFFVTPNAQRDGMFDLQNLSQEACQQLLDRHSEDVDGMKADPTTLAKYFKDSQWKQAAGDLNIDENDGVELVQLLKHAVERKNHAPMCYSVVVECLMQQNDKPFLIVMDEFNCYYDRGHYFHMAYDKDVREAIPYTKINLFEHAMGAMSLDMTDSDDDSVELTELKLMARGGIIVGTTESHAVRRVVTDGLVSNATRRSSAGDMHVVEVPRFSDIEVDHILANFEATGVGKLRLDRGETLMNKQEVEYLKMASGSIGQNLLDVSIM